MMLRIFLFLFLMIGFSSKSNACSIVYFIDSISGKIYVANNEDYWYNIKDYIQILPAEKDKHARLWYGWDNFAQGGVNSAGLFFDGAVTPEQEIPAGYKQANGRNLGDEILAYCKTVDEAADYFEKEKIAIKNGHLLFGDGSGNALVLEWVKGKREIVRIKNNVLVATNFLLSDTSSGNYPCYRYKSIHQRIKKLVESKQAIDLKNFGNVIAGAAQTPRFDENGKEGGTLYSSFINITDMKFVLVPKLDNTKVIILDLKDEFANSKKRKIKLYK